MPGMAEPERQDQQHQGTFTTCAAPFHSRQWIPIASIRNQHRCYRLTAPPTPLLCLSRVELEEARESWQQQLQDEMAVQRAEAELLQADAMEAWEDEAARSGGRAIKALAQSLEVGVAAPHT